MTFIYYKISCYKFLNELKCKKNEANTRKKNRRIDIIVSLGHEIKNYIINITTKHPTNKGGLIINLVRPPYLWDMWSEVCPTNKGKVSNINLVPFVA